MIAPEILQRLRCPQCAAPLHEAAQSVCCQHGHVLPRARGYLDALPSISDDRVRRTLRSFGYEWTSFPNVEPEDELYWHRFFGDVSIHSLKGAVALDAGCGKGRFSYYTADHVRSLVALDASNAVEAAVANLSNKSNVTVVKADVMNPPLHENSFDFVFSLGVVHHLPDPREGFRRIARLVAPGGLLLVYIYSRPASRGIRAGALWAASWLRRMTTRLPHGPLRVVSAPLAAVLYTLFVLPGAVGERLDVQVLARLPLQTYRRRPLRSLWLDTFDRLSAPIENRYLWSEIRPWFEKEGLEVSSVRDEAGLIVCARKAGGKG